MDQKDREVLANGDVRAPVYPNAKDGQPFVAPVDDTPFDYTGWRRRASEADNI